jgi:hypothetical protein
MIFYSFINMFNEETPDFNNTSFEDIILQYNLYPDYELSINEDNDIVINETWESLNDNIGIIASRIYNFDPDFIYLIPLDIRKSLLEEVLDLLVQVEKYEDAALVRDVIKYNSI